MKTELRPVTVVPDFLTKSVDRAWSKTKDCMAQSGGFLPVLSYVVDGLEFSVPLNYKMFVDMGKDMQFTRKAVEVTRNVGMPFAMMAMDMAERAGNQAKVAEDRERFLPMLGHMLYHVGPQAFFLSVPIRMLAGEFAPGELEHALQAEVGREPNAMLVVGRNRVRTYALATPFLRDAQGNFYYEQSVVLDSLAGHGDGGLFSEIYEPCQN